MNDELEFVWGQLSGDYLGERACSLETMNDIELIHWIETDDYSVNIESIYEFNGREDSKEYLKTLLAAFTRWMESDGYNTSTAPTLMNVFPNYRGRHNSIEKAYANFKALVMWYCSVPEYITQEEMEKEFGFQPLNTVDTSDIEFEEDDEQ